MRNSDYGKSRAAASVWLTEAAALRVVCILGEGENRIGPFLPFASMMITSAHVQCLNRR